MPLYGVPQAGGHLTAIQPGDNYYLLNAETVTAPQASVAFATGYTDAQAPNIVFTVSFASAPSAAQVDIQGSNVDVDGQYQTLNSSVFTGSTSTDYYSDMGKFAFYRAKVVSQTGGGAVTVLAQR